jgi:hypothetical protein
MRYIALMCVVVVLNACTSAASNSTNAPASFAPANNSFIGTWELVSTHVSRNDSTLMRGTGAEFRSLKMLNNTHFSVITRRGEQFLRAAAGRYTLNGENYTEMIDVSSATTFTPGAQYSFKSKIEGDTWTIDGGSGATRVQEVWRRVR